MKILPCVLATLLLLLPSSPPLSGQVPLTRHERNPILLASTESDWLGALNVFGLRESPYGWRFWYCGRLPYGNFTINDAVSVDGVEIYVYAKNPVVMPQIGGARKPSVVKAGGVYWMYYYVTVGSSYAIHLSTSPDGRTWQPHPGNPVVGPGGPGAWDGAGVLAPVVLLEGNTFRMWYQGWDGSFSSIGYATSTDGIAWTKHPGNPVLTHGGSPTDFDFLTAGEPACVRTGDWLHMYYTAVSGADRLSIGYARSADGLVWVKSSSNPVLTPGFAAWEAVSVAASFVSTEGTRLDLYYSGLDAAGVWRTGLARAPIVVSAGDPAGQETIPHGAQLPPLRSHPNPFNPSTVIEAAIPEGGGSVTLVIHDVAGRLVGRVSRSVASGGVVEFTWDGTAEGGVRMGSGVYFCSVELNGPGGRAVSPVHKLVLLR